MFRCLFYSERWRRRRRSSNGREHGVTSKFKFTFNWSVCVVVVVVAVAHSHLSLALSVQTNVHKFTIRQNFYFSSPSIQSAWRVFVCARFQRKWFCDRVYRRDSWIVVAGFVRMFFLLFFFAFLYRNWWEYIDENVVQVESIGVHVWLWLCVYVNSVNDRFFCSYRTTTRLNDWVRTAACEVSCLFVFKLRRFMKTKTEENVFRWIANGIRIKMLIEAQANNRITERNERQRGRGRDGDDDYLVQLK